MTTPEITDSMEEEVERYRILVDRCRSCRDNHNPGNHAWRQLDKELQTAIHNHSVMEHELERQRQDVERNIPDPTIVPGCWIDTPQGDCVCTGVSRWYVEYRYPAERCSDKTHIWVGHSNPWFSVKYLRDEDEESRRVLALQGPYGDE